MTDHADNGLLVEELNTLARQRGNINQGVGIRILVDQGVCNIESAACGVNDMHGTKVLVLRTDANHFVHYLDGVGILGIESCQESICLTSLYHHHAEVVAFKHFIVGLLEGIAFALTFLSQDTGIALAALLFRRMAQVDNLNTVNVQVELVGQFLNHLIVTQQDGDADPFSLCLNGSFQHGGMDGFGKDHALWVCCSGGIQLLG